MLFERPGRMPALRRMEELYGCALSPEAALFQHDHSKIP